MPATSSTSSTPNSAASALASNAFLSPSHSKLPTRKRSHAEHLGFDESENKYRRTSPSPHITRSTTPSTSSGQEYPAAEGGFLDLTAFVHTKNTFLINSTADILYVGTMRASLERYLRYVSGTGMRKRRPTGNEMMLNSHAGFRRNFQGNRSLLVDFPTRSLLHLLPRLLTGCLDVLLRMLPKQTDQDIQ